MNVRACLTGNRVGSKHRRAQPRQALATRNGADQQPAGLKDQMQGGSGKRKVVGSVEEADAQAKVELPGIEGQSLQVCSLPPGLPRQQGARVNDLNSSESRQALRPGGVGAAGDQRGGEGAANIQKAVEAIFESPVIEECFNANLRSAIAARGKQVMIEEKGVHAKACATRWLTRQGWHAIAGSSA